MQNREQARRQSRARIVGCRAGQKNQQGVAGSGVLLSAGGLADQAGQGGEIVEHIGQEDQGGDAGQAVDGQAFEAPGFEGGVSAFDGVSGAGIERLPGGAANGEIPGQADGAIGETFAEVDDAAMG